jgi:hypothetical protein
MTHITIEKEKIELALEALYLAVGMEPSDSIHEYPEMFQVAITALRSELAKQEQKRPQNCGTSYCSCIDCVMDKQEQGEPVGWPCVIETADFEEDTVTLKMQSKDYSVGVGLHWLYTTPQQRTWVGLTDEDVIEIIGTGDTMGHFIRSAEAKLKENNT